MQARSHSAYLLVLGSAVCCYASLGATIRILPGYVGSRLHESPLAVGFAIGAPALTAVLARPLGGQLADTHGPRAVVAAGAGATALAALPMYAHDYRWLVISRLLVGLGEGAFMSACVLRLLRFGRSDRRGRTLGHVGLANYAGLTLGPLLTDLLGGHGHPARVFAAAALLPLAGLAVVPFVRGGRAPHEPHRPGRRATTSRVSPCGPEWGCSSSTSATRRCSRSAPPRSAAAPSTCFRPMR